MSTKFFLQENDYLILQPELKDCRKNLSQRKNQKNQT